MAGPDLPIVIPAGTRQGTEEHWDDTMPGTIGMARTYRGRKREEDPLSQEYPKGHMVEEEA